MNALHDKCVKYYCYEFVELSSLPCCFEISVLVAYFELCVLLFTIWINNMLKKFRIIVMELVKYMMLRGQLSCAPSLFFSEHFIYLDDD